jgi:hypothetical protein
MSDNPWQSVKDAAQSLKDALNKAAHTSPADAVQEAKTKIDAIIAWADAKRKGTDVKIPPPDSEVQ